VISSLRYIRAKKKEYLEDLGTEEKIILKLFYSSSKGWCKPNSYESEHEHN
jgi:hypothetical protein